MYQVADGDADPGPGPAQPGDRRPAKPAFPNAGARLDRLPVGAFHYRMIALVGAGVFLDAFDIYLAGGVLAAMLRDGWSTLEMNATFVSVTFFGIMTGAFFSGLLSDRFGRTLCYQLNLLLFGIPSLLAAFVPDMGWLIVLRFVMGLGLGAEAVVSFALICELMPPRNRGRWIAAMMVIVNSSLFVCSMVGLWIIPTLGWRGMFVLVGVGALILWALRRSMPESPRWLEGKGRFAEAEAALADIERRYTDLPAPAAAGPAAPTAAAPAVSMPAVSMLVLFRRTVLPRTLLGTLFNITYSTVIYGLIGWLPSFFVKQGLTIVTSLSFTAVMSLGGPAGSLLSLAFADRIGRRTAVIAGSLASAGFALVYANMTEPAGLMAAGFAMITAIYFLVTAGFAFVPELFATDYRVRGMGFCSTVGRLVTALSQYAIVPAFLWGGVHAIVGSLAVLLAVQGLVFWLVAVETSRRPLEPVAPPKA